jgi:pimeloyl-ACP methyl ester carboxylesterase
MASGLSCVRDQGLDSFARRFADVGFAVLAFDYRCFGDSGGEPRQLFSAGRQREDWRAALACARSLDGVDATRIAIWGFSAGGGHVQALAMTEAGITAAICVAPVVDGGRTLLYIGGPGHVGRLGLAGARDGLRAVRRAEPYRVPAAGPPGSPAVLSSPGSLAGFESVTGPGSTWRNEICARAALAPPYRLARKTRRIACPILYCITQDDDINPPDLGRRAAEGAPKGELRLYPGGHFDPFLGDTFERMSADQVDFLTRHLAERGASRRSFRLGSRASPRP